MTYVIFQQIELPAKLLNYFLRSNKSNIHQMQLRSGDFRLSFFRKKQLLGGHPGYGAVKTSSSPDVCVGSGASGKMK